MDEHVERVRKLLAKADSSGFPAEAEAFRAKAAQIMARHGLSMAQVAPAPRTPAPSLVGTWTASGSHTTAGNTGHIQWPPHWGVQDIHQFTQTIDGMNSIINIRFG